MSVENEKIACCEKSTYLVSGVLHMKNRPSVQFSSVQSLSHVRLFVTP